RLEPCSAQRCSANHFSDPKSKSTEGEETMATAPRTTRKKGASDERTRRPIAPLLSQGELDVGPGSRVPTSNHRRGICRFEIQSCAEGEHHGPNQRYTRCRQDDYPSVSGEGSSSRTHRTAQAHQLDK